MLADLFSFRRKVTVQCLDYFKDPVAVIDGLSNIVELNSAFCAAFDIKHDEFIGKHFSSIEKLHGLAGALKGCLADRVRGTGQIKLGENVWSWVVYPIQSGRADGGLCGIQFQDVTRHIELEEELAKGNRLLMAVNTISTAFMYSDEISSVFESLIEKVQAVTDMPVCWIIVRSGEKLALRGAAGISRGLRMKLEAGILDGFHEEVMSLHDPFFVFTRDNAGKYPWFAEERIVFLVAQPLAIGTTKAGVLVIGSREPVSMGFDLAALIHLVGNHVSLAIEKVRLYEEARHLAVTDALTGLFNLRYFYDSMAMETARARRYGTRFSITIFDLDDFKAINDTFGHQAGDEVLKKVALVMKNVSRATDIVARYGGEEFVIIQANTPKAEALAQAIRVKNAVESEYYIDPGIRVSLSGGIAACPEDGGDGKSLLYSADMALYEAKSMGKRQIRLAGGRDETEKGL